MKTIKNMLITATYIFHIHYEKRNHINGVGKQNQGKEAINDKFFHQLRHLVIFQLIHIYWA